MLRVNFFNISDIKVVLIFVEGLVLQLDMPLTTIIIYIHNTSQKPINIIFCDKKKKQIYSGDI